MRGEPERADHGRDADRARVDALLRAAGLPPAPAGGDGPVTGCALEAWARSGGMALTGFVVQFLVDWFRGRSGGKKDAGKKSKPAAGPSVAAFRKAG